MTDMEGRMQSSKAALGWLLLACCLTWFVPCRGTPQCMAGCACDAESLEVICEDMYNSSLAAIVATLPNTTQKFYVNGAKFDNISAFDFSSRIFTDLNNLAFVNCRVSVFDQGVFNYIPNLQQLDINSNQISTISLHMLQQLANLTALNLSHNAIDSIEDGAFTHLRNLQVLDLSFNRLTVLSEPNMFQSVPFLRYLNLSYNNISYIHPAVFRNLKELTILNLDSNHLESLPSELLENTSLSELHLGGNPWHCHCGVEWLVHNLKDEQSSAAYKNTHRIQCYEPSHLSQIAVQDLSLQQLVCQHPEFYETPLSESFIVWHSYYLHCNATGYPKPSIYWQGPRGVLVHPSHRHFLPGDIHKFSQIQTYDGQPTYFKAVVKALENGSLEFTNFRYNYVGNYTCFAVNPMGSVSASAFVEIRSEIYMSVVWSVVFGSAVAFSFLIISIVVGSIRTCVEMCCCKEKNKTLYADEPYEDEAEFWDEYFRHPLDSHRPTPDYWPSPVKCITPAEPAKSELSDFNKSIFNTLDAVRTRLSLSMGRHMDHMRTRANHMRETGKNLRIDMNKKVERVRYKAYLMRESAGLRMTNLRESSSQTLRNIRSSSGQYAHRMREGMVVRVEAVKYSVKSLKEFCGTGNLGQTMSIPSMSTNVDSQETEEVYKTITFV